MSRSLFKVVPVAAALMLSAVSGTTSAQGLAGPYLAATQADLRNDYDAAAQYYLRVLRLNPDNPAILQSALITTIIADQAQQAEDLAGRLNGISPGNQIAGLTLLAQALKDGDFARAAELAGDDEYRMNPLFAQLAKAWAQVGQGDYDAAMATFDAMNQNNALQVYGQFHKALALALAGDFAQAATILDGTGEGPLHLSRIGLIAHISALSQADRMEDAKEVVRNTLGSDIADPELESIATRLDAGEAIPFDGIRNAADGAAAAYGLMAGALAREDAERFGLVYGRLATHIRPDYDEVRILVADTLARQDQFDLATATYAEIEPASPWYIDAEVGRADALRFGDKEDQGIEVLKNLARAHPGNLRIHTALGDALRSEEQFDAAATAYTRAIDLVENPNPSHWFLFYSRGITLERTDRWDEAEADFRKALELEPDQPLVLNYLGYSLVELNRNLDEAQGMIEKAVDQRPDDGYITDSLGWVLYKFGKYQEAVPYMERAVELVPLDPIINDHLGDVLWKVDRKLEAEFQWRRALSFEPEEKDAERIRRKLDVGLDKVLEEEAQSGPNDATVPTAQGD